MEADGIFRGKIKDLGFSVSLQPESKLKLSGNIDIGLLPPHRPVRSEIVAEQIDYKRKLLKDVIQAGAGVGRNGNPMLLALSIERRNSSLKSPTSQPSERNRETRGTFPSNASLEVRLQRIDETSDDVIAATISMNGLVTPDDVGERRKWLLAQIDDRIEKQMQADAEDLKRYKESYSKGTVVGVISPAEYERKQRANLLSLKEQSQKDREAVEKQSDGEVASNLISEWNQVANSGAAAAAANHKSVPNTVGADAPDWLKDFTKVSTNGNANVAPTQAATGDSHAHQKRCPTCGGSGKIESVSTGGGGIFDKITGGDHDVWTTCPTCGGTGWVPDN